MRKRDKHSIDYAPAQKERRSLKQKLMAAVANGDDNEAEALRQQLKAVDQKARSTL